MSVINIGTAGWTIPREQAGAFPAEGTGLQRYAARFRVAEINSSFHRAHRASTWERWRDSVPPGFRFSVKVPKQITHQHKLVGCSDLLGTFLAEAGALGDKLAVLLVQLPPKLEFEERVASDFFSELRASSSAHVACEPRHASWFTATADDLLRRLQVARVGADPAICPEAASPSGWTGLSYRRLHGSPSIYRSSYGDRVSAYANQIRRDAVQGRETWCIFDNTASSAAAGDALSLMHAVAEAGER